MSKHPLIVNTEWLAERLEDPNLRIVDATTFLKIPDSEEEEVGMWSGRDAYNQGHIPGAVFADLMHELSDPEAPLPMTVPPQILAITVRKSMVCKLFIIKARSIIRILKILSHPLSNCPNQSILTRKKDRCCDQTLTNTFSKEIKIMSV
ncbi:rhodanese-like domain-containing protein [Neobacillus citreus]|uniref:Rhodanese domain-containing protein n=1 Tax=Neobacillus citreus TaxID=2833578 RepID=A0A942T4M1_9BACI|nr:rhodanese-like domain-containing protein [Neobacillus citreus]MCH6269139.1 hypothetical protein [Neobacillus citreus]